MRPFPKLQNGFTMMPLILFMFVIVGLISAGYMMLGPKVQLGKTVEAKAGLEKAVDAIISWSVANGRIPKDTEFASTIPNQNDSWGKSIYYIYDETLANTTVASYGGICGKTHTYLTVQTCSDTACTTPTTITPDVAFVLLSGGANVNNQTRGTGPITAATTVNVFTTTTNIDNYATDVNRVEAYDDLFKIVTLEELKNRAGCYSSTQGRLKILNNELPKVCDGSSSTSYATLHAGGGVATGYSWSVQNAPTWLKCNNSACSGGTFTGGTLSLSLVSAAPPITNLSFSLSDGINPSVSRLLPIVKSTSAACSALPPGGSSNFDDITNDFSKTEGLSNNITINPDKTINLGSGGTGGTNGYGCIWDKTNKLLTGYTFRGYFEFKTNIDTSSASSTYGDGFTFAIMQGANPTTVCGGAGEVLGYGTRDGHSIPGDSFAIEFDTFPNSAQNDPTNYNHLAVVKNGSVKHNTTLNPTCFTTDPICFTRDHPGCSYRSPVSWMEDGATHKVRIEVATKCNATCSSCGPSTPSGGYALIKAWIDCTDASCSSLLANYTAQVPSINHCMVLPASMGQVKIGFTEATWGARQSTIISNFAAGFYIATDITNAIPYRIWNNSGAPRWYTCNDGTTTSGCSTTSVTTGSEFLQKLYPQGTLKFYSNNTCTTLTNTLYYPTVTGDTNLDGCLNLDLSDRSCP
jgi:hypothetical protein